MKMRNQSTFDKTEKEIQIATFTLLLYLEKKTYSKPLERNEK